MASAQAPPTPVPKYGECWMCGKPFLLRAQVADKVAKPPADGELGVLAVRPHFPLPLIDGEAKRCPGSNRVPRRYMQKLDEA